MDTHLVILNLYCEDCLAWYLILVTISEILRKLFSDVHFSESGSTERKKEEATYMKFLKYMEELEGMCVYIYK